MDKDVAVEVSTEQVPFDRIAHELHLTRRQVEVTTQLLDEGNTVPFITRYRKHVTDNLDEQQIRAIEQRVRLHRHLTERRQTVLRTIESQGKLTPSLKKQILAAGTLKRLEDLYLPYKPKKRSLATAAREKGLGPLAEAIFRGDEEVRNLNEIVTGVVDPDKGLNSVDDVLVGVKHILAELISEDADVRESARQILWNAKISAVRSNNADEAASKAAEAGKPADTSKVNEAPKDEAATHVDGEHAEEESEEEVGEDGVPDRKVDTERLINEYKNYFNFSQPLKRLPPHRILALTRGEKAGILKVKLEADRDHVMNSARQALKIEEHPHQSLMDLCLHDAVDRLLLRGLEREIRSELFANAQKHSVTVFQRNLRNLLMQPPVVGKRVLAVDPGFRTGCKFAILDEIGNLIEDGVIFPHTRHKKKKKKSKSKLNKAVAATREYEKAQATSDSFGSPELLEGDEATVSDESADSSADEVAAQTETDSNSPPALPMEGAYHSTDEHDPPLDIEGSAANSEPDSPTASASETPVAEAQTADPAVSHTSEQASGDAVAEDDSETEVNRLWQEIKQERQKPKPKKKRKPREAKLRPAWVGIVIPTPDNINELTKAKPSPRPTVDDHDDDDDDESRGGVLGTQPTRRERARQTLTEMCQKYGVEIIAIGNGTASRETEEVVSNLIANKQLSAKYIVVNEAGASVYSTSNTAREEFPEYDATLRSTISIGRRLQDPLSELVKIDPQNLGVGMYQHDVNHKLLRESLNEVVESAVNFVGVDLNTASVPLLQYVSGLNQQRAKSIVEYRKTNGPFRNREQLKDVPNIGPAVFTQAAGFLKITDGDQPLDSTWIHPESYPAATMILNHLGFQPSVLHDRTEVESLRQKCVSAKADDVARELSLEKTIVADILANFARPGRDPREDLPPPIFRTGVLKLEDLSPGMMLMGNVLNVVDFGAFIDIGLKETGLVHISQLSSNFIEDPHDVVLVGDIVKTWVMTVDKERRRVSLTMIEPGTERRDGHGHQHDGHRRQAGGGRGRPQRGGQERGRPNNQLVGQAAGPQGQGQVRPAQGQGGGQGDRGPRQGYGQRGGGRPAQGQGQPGQGQGQGYGQGRGPQGGQGQGQGYGRGRGPGRPGDRRPGQYGQQGQGYGQRPAPQQQSADAPKPKPKKPKPPIKLTQAALDGKEVLRSFGELKAFFSHNKPKDEGKPGKPDGTQPPTDGPKPN